MKKHTKIYFDYFGYGEQDVIMCERDNCGQPAVDIHHIEAKGMGGRHGDEAIKINRIENLIALCRKCHEKAHAGEIIKGLLLLWHRHTMSPGGRTL